MPDTDPRGHQGLESGAGERRMEVRAMNLHEYYEKWGSRRDNVDCTECEGGQFSSVNQPAGPQECCAYTGLDAIPWSELFTAGRNRVNK